MGKLCGLKSLAKRIAWRFSAMDGLARFARTLCFALSMVAAASVGCSVFRPAVSDDPRAEFAAKGGTPGTPAAKYFVELHPEGGQPTRAERSLTGPLTVQQALTETEALKKYRRSTIELVRPLANGAVHRMAVEYDRSAKMVAPEFDYSLQPGDRIIVKEDTSTIVDDMLDQTLGQYNPRANKKPLSGRTKSGGFFRVGD
jgi:hypothetical protein